MSDYLPEEVLIEVFLRLATKSIIRCTSVCKSWYSLLTRSNFISIHLKKQEEYLLVRHNSGEPEKEIYALFCDNENFDEYVEFDFPFECGRLNIVGSCNGLLCFSDDYRIEGFRDLFYLWNPSIRKSFQLPQPIFTLETRGPRGFDHTHGFGFDRVTNDYKVVRILPTKEVPPHVELYKLSTGVWQDITHVSPHRDFLQRIPGVYVNGACHWVASGRQNMIVLFDVHEEKFSDIMAPESIVNKSFGSFGRGCLVLFVSDESLCLVDRLHGGDGIIDIWLMKEYGEAESWVKQFRIKLSHITYPVDVVDIFFSPLSFLERPIASRKNGEILWRADEGLLVSYDPATKKIKNLGIHNAHTFFSYAFHVHTYKASLMLLGKRTDYFAGDTCKDSSNLCTRGSKGGREKFLKADAKRGLQIVHVKNESNEAAHDKTEEQVSG